MYIDYVLLNTHDCLSLITHTIMLLAIALASDIVLLVVGNIVQV